VLLVFQGKQGPHLSIALYDYVTTATAISTVGASL